MKAALPLFNWQMAVEADRLQRERDDLSKRIQKLRPRSHRRVELEFRLRELTSRQIAIESGSTADRGPF